MYHSLRCSEESLPKDLARSKENKRQVTFQFGLIGTGISCTKCVSNTGYMETARVQKEETSDTKACGGYESPIQGLTSAKDLTLLLPGGRDILYHGSD